MHFSKIIVVHYYQCCALLATKRKHKITLLITHTSILLRYSSLNFSPIALGILGSQWYFQVSLGNLMELYFTMKFSSICKIKKENGGRN